MFEPATPPLVFASAVQCLYAIHIILILILNFVLLLQFERSELEIAFLMYSEVCTLTLFHCIPFLMIKLLYQFDRLVMWRKNQKNFIATKTINKSLWIIISVTPKNCWSLSQAIISPQQLTDYCCVTLCLLWVWEIRKTETSLCAYDHKVNVKE